MTHRKSPRSRKSRRKSKKSRRKSKKSRNWMKNVIKSMKKHHTVGRFTLKSKRRGLSVHQNAKRVVKKYKGKKNLTAAERTYLREAVLALTFERAAKRYHQKVVRRKSKKRKSKNERYVSSPKRSKTYFP